MPFTSIFSSPNNFSLLETEALFGEKFEVLKEGDDFFYGKLETDGYKGWIKKSSVCEFIKPNYRVTACLSIVKFQASHKSKTITILPMGSLIKVYEYNQKWFKTEIILKKRKISGFIPFNHITKIGKKNKNWVNFSKSLLNSPYKWGGRTCLGLDCSALLQLSLQIAGINLPRNTKEQKNAKYFRQVFKSSIKKGNVVFWPGHVGIMISPTKIIHSNATTSNTIIENLEDVNRKIFTDSSFSFSVYKVKEK